MEEEIIDRINIFYKENPKEAQALTAFLFPNQSVTNYIRENFKPYKGKSKKVFFTAGELSSFFFKKMGVIISANSIGRLLTALGYKAKVRSLGGRVRRGYEIDPKSNVDAVILLNISK